MTILRALAIQRPSSLLLAALLAVSVTVLGCSADSTPPNQGLQGRPGQAQHDTAPPAALRQSLPPVPLDLGSVDRAALAIQTQTQNGSDASQRSAGAIDDGTNLSLVAASGELAWGIWEFTPPAGTLQSAIVSMDVVLPGSAWIAIANYDRLAWEFKGPYPALAGVKGFLNLATGDYVSPGGKTYVAALAWDSTAATVTEVEITVDDGQNPTFTVSGTITNSAGGAPLPGATVNLQGSSEAPALTNAQGQYSFSGIEAGAYTIVPSMANFSFEPVNRAINVSNADVTGQDFVGTLDIGGPPFTVSGTIEDAEGTPMEGVTVMVPFEQMDTVTDAQGNYSFEVLAANDDFRVVPLLTGFTFTPNIAFLNVDSDKVQDFVVEAYSIPETVSYATHMRPLVFEPVCMNCHNSAYVGFAERHSAPADVNWDTYDGTTLLKKQNGNARAQTGTMPPATFHATINLTDSQKALFQKWADGAFQP